MEPAQIQAVVLPFLGGSFFSTLALFAIHKVRVGSYRRLEAEILRGAESDANSLKQSIEQEARKSAEEASRQQHRQHEQELRKLQREAERLRQREDKIEERSVWNERRRSELERKEKHILTLEEHCRMEQSEINVLRTKLDQELQSLSGMTREEARERLLRSTQEDVRGEVARMTERLVNEAREDADRQARSILATAISRLAVPCTSEVTVSLVNLPGDDLKGRIIGREGRNIRAFEKATGANIVIDDTPGAVVISCFDPVRRHIAKSALGELLLDGRIHPTRIEEVVEQAKADTDKEILRYGKDACKRAGVFDLHPQLVTLLGKLHFRSSYGQNVLSHSLEVAHLMGMVAAELELNVPFAKRLGLLHDIGKAATHEVEGTHALIGHDLALKYGESVDVANGIGCHHGEIDPLTVEGSLVGAMDALSASRPGARIEAVEEYMKRLRRLESIAKEFPGVSNVYALQAGREIRVTVLPDMVDDAGALHLARDISRSIEKRVDYPGAIKVTVIRERRAIQYAS